MSAPSTSLRPLAGLKQALRQCRAERQRQQRTYATTYSSAGETTYPSLQLRQPPPGFRPSQATKQNRFEEGFKKIPVFPAPRSMAKACPNAIAAVTASQLTVLDPTGARARLFSKTNPERAQAGDILLVRLKTGDPFAGVCLSIRRTSPIDTAILLRNQLTRVGAEMWFKVYSPNVEGIEVVQRKERRARRARLYYMRQPKHDVGSVDNVVRQYQRQRAGGALGSKGTKGRDANSGKKKNNKRGRN